MTIYDSTKLIEIRRTLHRHPELSHNESRTAALVAAKLEAIGLTVRSNIGGHGVIADIVGDKPGPTLLYRADMDALPIQETAGRSYGSQNPGVMHACGHDVHTTIGLGVASRLSNRRAELHGCVRMLFQPAEEAAPPPDKKIGAAAMVEEGALQNPAVDAAFALHVMPTLPVGTLGYSRGPVWAASDLFDIHLHGGMAHGAYPHQGRDTVYVAAQLVQALQQIPSRNVDTTELCVISVGRIQAGTAYNIMPDYVHIQGLIRTHSPSVRQTVLRRFHEVIQGIASAGECTADVNVFVGTKRTANDPVLEAFAVESIRSHGALEPMFTTPQMGAEDFAAISGLVPSAYLLLGVRNESKGIIHMIHTPEFDVDESCLEPGAEAMTHALLDAGKRWASLDGRIEPAP
jgi:amidohydrolase